MLLLTIRKAFNLANRSYLWQLLNHQIDGTIFKIISSLYANIKSCVRVGHMKSESFVSNVRVRQCDNFSQLMFSLFLKVFSEFISHDYNGLKFLKCLQLC